MQRAPSAAIWPAAEQQQQQHQLENEYKRPYGALLLLTLHEAFPKAWEIHSFER